MTLKCFHLSSNQAYRHLAFIVTSLKIKKWRPPTLYRKGKLFVKSQWNRIKLDSLINEIFRIVIITMYILHSILFLVNYYRYLIHFYKFATNRNPTLAELMSKCSSSGVLNHIQMRTKLATSILKHSYVILMNFILCYSTHIFSYWCMC